MLDRILGGLILLMLSPFLIIILLVSWIDTGAFPIFIQIRTVNGSSNFKCYKVRSMHHSAPILPTNQFNNPDEYISIWGSFIRRYSLDELLNFVSIFNGDMTIIGPRPVITNEIELISIRNKHGIKNKGGLTGLAQIKGRDNITLENKIKYEKFYQINNNWKLRTYIIYKTVILIIKSEGVSH